MITMITMIAIIKVIVMITTTTQYGVMMADKIWGSLSNAKMIFIG